MIICCVKWGDKFNHKHVNRLYKMVCKNYHDDFTFVCHTENSIGIDPNIKIVPLNLSHNLENWWWKLTLFKDAAEPSIFLDLDVVIQNDITHFKNYCQEEMICLVKAYWKPYELNLKPYQFDMDLNSSIMIWSGNCHDVWDKFEQDQEYYMLKYNGIDSYLYYDQPDKLLWIPKGEVYSRLYGIDENNYWQAGTEFKNYFYSEKYNICIFNGWRRKPDKINNKYLLDDDGYNGLEKYY